MEPIELFEPAVARDLGQIDAAEIAATLASPPDDGLGAHLEQGQAVAVDQHQAGFQAQAGDGALHREQRRLQDVEAVDLLDAGLAMQQHSAWRGSRRRAPRAGRR